MKLLRKVDRSGGPDACWPWLGKHDQNGYGRIFIAKGRTRPASRMALELHLGRTLNEDEDACHTCDNPPCCNVRHLFVGNAKINGVDMMTKGRARGVALNALKTHCLRGHSLMNPENLLPRADRHRECRLCGQQRQREYRLRRRTDTPKAQQGSPGGGE